MAGQLVDRPHSSGYTSLCSNQRWLIVHGHWVGGWSQDKHSKNCILLCKCLTSLVFVLPNIAVCCRACSSNRTCCNNEEWAEWEPGGGVSTSCAAPAQEPHQFFWHFTWSGFQKYLYPWGFFTFCHITTTNLVYSDRVLWAKRRRKTTHPSIHCA